MLLIWSSSGRMFLYYPEHITALIRWRESGQDWPKGQIVTFYIQWIKIMTTLCNQLKDDQMFYGQIISQWLKWEQQLGNISQHFWWTKVGNGLSYYSSLWWQSSELWVIQQKSVHTTQPMDRNIFSPFFAFQRLLLHHVLSLISLWMHREEEACFFPPPAHNVFFTVNTLTHKFSSIMKKKPWKESHLFSLSSVLLCLQTASQPFSITSISSPQMCL